MNTHYPLVTINIPTFNQERYISRAIESCLQQDYPNLEVIVSDDCSTDSTFAKAAEYVKHGVRLHRTPRNLGRVGNYRHALYDLAGGAWVANLDGDDYYDCSTFVSEAIAHLSQHPSCLMYVGGSSSVSERTGKISRAPIHLKRDLTLLTGADYVLGFYKYGQIGQHFAVLYKRSLALEVGFYQIDALGSDTDSICRLALRGDVLVHRKWVGVWTSHGANASNTLTLDVVGKELRMLEHIAADAKERIPAEALGQWLAQSKKLKYKHALVASIPFMSFGQAARELTNSWSWELQDFKELAKLILRTALPGNSGRVR